MFENRIYVKIKGRNVERFIKRLNKNNINIYNIKYLKYNEIIIKINKIDFSCLNNLKTIYEIDIVDISGMDKIKQVLKKNMYLIIGIFISFVILFLLTNTIFNVQVIHNNKDLKKIILNELEKQNVKKYQFKKSYKELEKIKKNILTKYKDQIEWLEIENVGTKYIVRVEERIIKKENKDFYLRNIVAKKDATLLKIEAKQGEVLKEKYEYVHKGEVVISGDIKLNDEVKNKTMADGYIFGEVWYKTKIEYPYNYKEIIYTGKVKKVLVLKIFNNYYEILNFKKYKTKKRIDNVLLKHSFLPIEFILEKQYETKEYSKKLTKEEAIKKAISKTKKQIENNLSDKERILDIKKLKLEENNSKIILELFISVFENITDYIEIKEQEE